MRIIKDITGIRFGKLEAIRCVGKDKYGNLWECKCDCGGTKIVRTNALTTGRVKSCGCELHKRSLKIGDRFGYLVVLEIPKGNLRRNKILCKCDCGNIGEYFLNNLRRGTTTSCGCKRSDYAKISRNCHGESTSILYKKWASIKTRCNNPNSSNYKDYGGRGIKICEEWKDFWPFREWAYENGYNDKLSIERKDVNGDYSPENCEWIELNEQANNKRNSVFIEYNGIKQTASQWGKELGVDRNTITYRVRAGWNPEECLFGKEKNVTHSKPRMDIPDYLKN